MHDKTCIYPLVSVIVPNYNYAQYLPTRLESILNQTYHKIEVILLDDVSTDNSLAILQRYQAQDQRILPIIVNTTNSGSPFHQWEKGIRLAQGKYIWIAEADDDADSRLLEQAVSILEKDENIILCKVDSYLIDTDNHRLTRDLDRWQKRHIQEGQIDYYNGKKFIRHEQYWVNRIYNASGVVFRRDAVTEQSFQSFNIPNVADWLFWANLATQGDIAEIHKRFNYFRQHHKSLTHSDKALRQAALVDAEVMHRIQQLIHIPLGTRLWRARKTIKHYHLLSRHLFDQIIKVIRLAIITD